MKILVTGFSAFQSVRVNPTERMIEELLRREGSRRGEELLSREASRRRGDSLPQTVAIRRRIETVVLPTEYAAATRKLRRLIASSRPDAVLCLGVAPRRELITLERVALNLDDDALADNAGRVRRGQPILRGGPPAYWSTLPLKAMEQALRKRGIRAQISNHAGAFLCNHAFYVARHSTARRRIPCGFVHVPRMVPPGSRSRRGMTLATMIRAVECLIDCLNDCCKASSRVAIQTNSRPRPRRR